MSKIKGKYEAKLTIDFDLERDKYTRPFEEIRSDILNGEMTDGIKRVLENEISVSGVTVTVEQLYASIHEFVHEENGEQNES